LVFDFQKLRRLRVLFFAGERGSGRGGKVEDYACQDGGAGGSAYKSGMFLKLPAGLCGDRITFTEQGCHVGKDVNGSIMNLLLKKRGTSRRYFLCLQIHGDAGLKSTAFQMRLSGELQVH
jgi:hypothetical protein